MYDGNVCEVIGRGSRSRCNYYGSRYNDRRRPEYLQRRILTVSVEIEPQSFKTIRSCIGDAVFRLRIAYRTGSVETPLFTAGRRLSLITKQSGPQPCRTSGAFCFLFEFGGLMKGCWK